MSASAIRRRRAIRSYADLGASAFGRLSHPAARVETLLDALNEQLCLARLALAQGMGAQRAKALARASMLVAGLHRGLDSRQAPGLARRLGGIYRYLLARINRINRKNGEAVLAELTGLVATLRGAWSESMRLRSVGAKDPPAAIHLAQGKFPVQVVALDELDRRHPRALGLLEVVDEQVVAYAHGRKGITHPVGASDFSV